MSVVRITYPYMSNLKFSVFSHRSDNQPKVGEGTWEELAGSLRDVRATKCTPETCEHRKCPEKDGAAWSPASYPKETLQRGVSFVESVCALVLDIDHVPSDDLLADFLNRVQYKRVIHASHSDRPGDRCVRVVVALSRPVPGKEWPKFWTNVIAHLGIPIARKGTETGGIDPQTKDSSRLFFLPSRPASASHLADQDSGGDGTDYLYASVDGPPINVDEFLGEPTVDPLALPQERPEAQQPRAAIVSAVTHSQDGRQQALQALLQAWPPEGFRHEATLALCGALAHSLWEESDIADFVQEFRNLLYPQGDPTPTKANDQARDSVRKMNSGQEVSGWPTLEKHIGADAVALIRNGLGLSNSTPQWVRDMQANRVSTPKAPTVDMIEVDLKKAKRNLANRRGNTDAMLDARMLKRILEHEQLQEINEDKGDALEHAIKVLDKYTPTGTTTEQIVSLLGHIHTFDFGQGDMPWADALTLAVTKIRSELHKEAGTTFTIALTGPGAGKPINNSKNWDIAMKKLKAKVAFDQFADAEVLQIADLQPEVIEDHHIAWLRDRMERTFELKPPKDEFYDYITVQARDNPFHAPREYFTNIETTWDGKERARRWLIDYCGAEDTVLNEAIGRIVLVAAVRRTRQPGCKFDEMLILEGEQGVQKSSGLAALCPNEDWFADGIHLDGDTKSQMEITGGKLIIEAAELVGKKKGDVDKLKSYLSRGEDTARMAYGRKKKKSPRQFIIIGTTNNAQYLRDPTGNRRFWPVAIVFVDLDAIKRDRDQLWAEAATLETQGFSIRLDPSLYNVAAEQQELRRIVDPYEVILSEALGEKAGRIRTTDVWQLLGKDQAEARVEDQVRMGEVMERLGWELKRPRINGVRTYMYEKGDPQERNVILAASGRKVVATAMTALIGTETVTKEKN